MPERYGDVFIWFEIVRLAAAQKRSIMFVTDDEKEDWWHIVEGRKLGPRPELRAEIRKQSPVEFGICSPARLLQNIGGELSVSVDASSVEDAKKIAEELRLTQYGHDQWKAWSLEMRAELAVEKWLQRSYPDATFARQSGSGSDFTMLQGSLRTAVEIVAIESIEAAPVLQRRLVEFASRRSPDQLLVVVRALERIAERTRDAMPDLVLPDKHSPIVLGYLEDGSYFYRLSDL